MTDSFTDPVGPGAWEAAAVLQRVLQDADAQASVTPGPGTACSVYLVLMLSPQAPKGLLGGGPGTIEQHAESLQRALDTGGIRCTVRVEDRSLPALVLSLDGVAETQALARWVESLLPEAMVSLRRLRAAAHALRVELRPSVTAKGQVMLGTVGPEETLALYGVLGGEGTSANDMADMEPAELADLATVICAKFARQTDLRVAVESLAACPTCPCDHPNQLRLGALSVAETARLVAYLQNRGTESRKESPR